MYDRNLDALSERERACVTHLRQAQELGVSFSQYYREKDLKIHQWTWIKRALVRNGVIDGPQLAAEKARVELTGAYTMPAASSRTPASSRPDSVAGIRRPWQPAAVMLVPMGRRYAPPESRPTCGARQNQSMFAQEK